jgi:hypothetical protein
MSAFIPAPTGWVAKIGEGDYRSVVGFNAESGDPVIVKRPDLGDGDPTPVAVFYDPSKAPGAPVAA